MADNKKPKVKYRCNNCGQEDYGIVRIGMVQCLNYGGIAEVID